eukprot:CAMPEP_0202920016 /NCGR_PEP_ID=MMETSP1392-20130828/76635_1 /ASSEMBLY_ACC=CAM_ASM_000868 /TAXON_ID=225041 /ORGANISM="Chlamydomonas chlamydogama, Strain SAG 11-48b" /LENGTH=227 /DNA_ID=CAMNT_0049613493 /DNA_START=47 /DNA_END=730 /DNA_ORIENTATION=+
MALAAATGSMSVCKPKISCPFRQCTHISSRVRCVATQAQSQEHVGVSRRTVLDAASVAVLSLSMPGLAQAAKAPKGFNPVEDLNDGYKFLYPFGWQEVAVKGTDVVYKDVVEPLESVSVTLAGTDKKDITDFGPVAEVSETLARDVLTAPGTEVKLLNTAEREDDKGHKYYELEFTATTSRYTRHQLAVVAVGNGKLYTLTTGSSEKRWSKMKDRLQTSVRSFSLLF